MILFVLILEVVVEKKSEARKVEELKRQIKELERIIGQKQIQIDFKDKMIELAEKQYKLDIKKKFGGQQLYGSGTIEIDTSIK